MKGARDFLSAMLVAIAACACPGCDEPLTPADGTASSGAARTDPPTSSEQRGQKQSTPNSEESPGQPLPGRYVIIHADDAGMCDSVNRATIDALEHGAVTSVSIMVPCPAFEEFAEYAASHPEHDYGIHLTLNAEFASYRWGPVASADEVPSLIDRDGFLWRSEHQTAANARVDEVERELRAQIDKALDHDVPLSHLDSHMGTLFMRADFLDVYLRLGDEYDLPVLLTRDDGLARRLGFDDRNIAQMRSAADQLEREGFPIVDKILMHYSWDPVPQKKQIYLNMIRRAPAGVTEIIVHCGYADRELRLITGSYSIRDGDRQVFTDPEVLSAIESQDVELISWKEFRQLTSERTPGE